MIERGEKTTPHGIELGSLGHDDAAQPLVPPPLPRFINMIDTDFTLFPMKQQVSVAKLADYLKVGISYFFWFCMKSISSNSTFSLEATDSDKIPATGPERILQRTRKGQSSSTETADLELNLAQMFTWHYLLIMVP